MSFWKCKFLAKQVFKSAKLIHHLFFVGIQKYKVWKLGYNSAAKTPKVANTRSCMYQNSLVHSWVIGALAGWFSWRNVIPTLKNCGFDPRSGYVREATDQCFSLSPPKINKNISSGEDFINKNRAIKKTYLELWHQNGYCKMVIIFPSKYQIFHDCNELKEI